MSLIVSSNILHLSFLCVNQWYYLHGHSSQKPGKVSALIGNGEWPLCVWRFRRLLSDDECCFRSMILCLTSSCTRIDLHSNCHTTSLKTHSRLLVTFCKRTVLTTGFLRLLLTTSAATVEAVLQLLLLPQSLMSQKVSLILHYLWIQDQW